MAQVPDDKDYDEFMNASAEEWSKPQTPSEPSTPGAGVTSTSKANRWGSEPIEPTLNEQEKQVLKDKSRKWITIAIIVVAVVCLCALVTLVVLPLLGIGLFSNLFQF